MKDELERIWKETLLVKYRRLRADGSGKYLNPRRILEVYNTGYITWSFVVYTGHPVLLP
jgi:hypothetical protein